MKNFSNVAAFALEVMHDEAATVEAIDKALTKANGVLVQVNESTNERELIEDDTARWWQRARDRLLKQRAVAVKQAARHTLGARSRSVLKVLDNDAASVDTVDAALIETQSALRFYDELAATISERRPLLPEGRRETGEQDSLRRAVEQDLITLHAGIGETDLVNDHRLEVLRGHRGLNWWLRVRDRLVTRRAAAVERAQTTWPREFRYTGQRFRTEIDGRYLEPGDTASLNAQQAEAFKDRFELATTESTPAVTA